jgi:hypothetical protein
MTVGLGNLSRITLDQLTADQDQRHKEWPQDPYARTHLRKPSSRQIPFRIQ